MPWCGRKHFPWRLVCFKAPFHPPPTALSPAEADADWDDTDSDSSASPPPRPDPARQMLARPNSRPLPATARLDGVGEGPGCNCVPPISPFLSIRTPLHFWMLILVPVFPTLSVSYRCCWSCWHPPPLSRGEDEALDLIVDTRLFFPVPCRCTNSGNIVRPFQKPTTTPENLTQIHRYFASRKAKETRPFLPCVSHSLGRTRTAEPLGNAAALANQAACPPPPRLGPIPIPTPPPNLSPTPDRHPNRGSGWSEARAGGRGPADGCYRHLVFGLPEQNCLPPLHSQSRLKRTSRWGGGAKIFYDTIFLRLYDEDTFVKGTPATLVPGARSPEGGPPPGRSPTLRIRSNGLEGNEAGESSGVRQ